MRCGSVSRGKRGTSWRTSNPRAKRLQVANLAPGDGGRGVARLPVKLMNEMGLAEGDVIEIAGKRATAARAIRPYAEDEGLEVIRLDGLQRANAEVGSGDHVEIRKAESKPATRVVFAPAQHNMRLQGSAEALKRSFFGRPLVAGDIVATAGQQRVNADMPDASARCSTPRPSRSQESA